VDHTAGAHYDFVVGEIAIDADPQLRAPLDAYLGAAYPRARRHRADAWHLRVLVEPSLAEHFERDHRAAMSRSVQLEHDKWGYVADGGSAIAVLLNDRTWSVDLTKTTRRLIVRGIDAAAAVSAAKRVVRTVVRGEVENRGGCFIHASAVGLGSRGIAFVGRKGSGKTTCLLELLATRAATYIANDFLFVLPGPALMPGLAGPLVGQETLRRIPEFRHLLGDETLRRLNGITAGDVREIKLYVDVDQVQAAFGCLIPQQVTLGAVVFPSFGTTPETHAFPLTDSTVRERLLSDSELWAEHTTDHPDWLGISQARDHENAPPPVATLLADVPFWSVALGTAADRGSALLAAVSACI
jgi:hypothetical protein